MKKDEEIKQKLYIEHIDMDNSMLIARGKGGWAEVELGKGEINGDGKKCYFV